MTVFEECKQYEAYDSGLDAVEVIKRTPKTITVTNGFVKWRMKIEHDGDGNEVAVDKKVPPKWRFAFTYSSKLERRW